MMAAIPRQETFALTASTGSEVPLRLEVFGFVPTLPPLEPAW